MKTIDDFIAETTPKHQPFKEFLIASQAAAKMANNPRVCLTKSEIRALFDAVPELAEFAEMSSI